MYTFDFPTQTDPQTSGTHVYSPHLRITSEFTNTALQKYYKIYEIYSQI